MVEQADDARSVLSRCTWGGRERTLPTFLPAGPSASPSAVGPARLFDERWAGRHLRRASGSQIRMEPASRLAQA